VRPTVRFMADMLAVDMYLMPLPQWHASLRPSRGGRTTSLTLFEVSSLRVRPIVSRCGVPR
jgi:hypothetical protein